MPAHAWKALTGSLGWLLRHAFPLLPALYTNTRYLSGEPHGSKGALPSGKWVTSEAAEMLACSENRLQGLEDKGQGLATVCAIVAAAIGLALSLTWVESTGLARVLLVVAAGYCAMSLWAPLVLAGPVGRDTVTRATVEGMAAEADPVGCLAQHKVRAAAVNDLTTRRLSNLQAASCSDVIKAILLFGVWAVIALTGNAAT